MDIEIDMDGISAVNACDLQAVVLQTAAPHLPRILLVREAVSAEVKARMELVLGVPVETVIADAKTKPLLDAALAAYAEIAIAGDFSVLSHSDE